ncbi:E3 ubiquitin-protein ligase TRIM45-like [Glandiceps talaboti]
MNGFSSAANSVSSTASKIKCEACRKQLRDPRLLPCLHTFCKECLNSVNPYVVTSDKDFGSGSVASGSSSASSSKSRLLTILCPTCDAEVDLPDEGVEGLPVNFVSQKLILLESLNQESNKIQCDLCEDSSTATARCEECLTYLCSFCLQAHKRQRKTSSHTMLTLQEAREKGIRDIHRPVFCSKHMNEEMKMFCETCDETVCRDCCLVEHREHRCYFIEDVSVGKKKAIRNLLSQTRPHIDVLSVAIDSVTSMETSVKEKAEQVNTEITTFFDSYVEALEKHRSVLQHRVKQVESEKRKILQLQKIQLQQILKDFEDSCNFVNDALEEGSGVEVLSIRKFLVNRLKELSVSKYICEPKENSFIKFDSDDGAGMVDGFEVKGKVTSKETKPLKCIVKGEGLSEGTQGERAEFLVLVKQDNNGVDGKKYQLKVEMVAKDDHNRKVNVQVSNEKNGFHLVTYVPPVPGQYILHVVVNGKHIQGSPFIVTIKPNQILEEEEEEEVEPVKHTGRYHCCTFCSSGGKKEATCGCGATMPGGFLGCGHGHPGHPGRKHWSCCGQIDRGSSCRGVSMKAISNQPNNTTLQNQNNPSNHTNNSNQGNRYYTLPKSFKTVSL